jgi:hypothetical protein
MDKQEEYLNQTPLIWGKNSVVLRGMKKLITELTSVKTLFLTFICVATWYGKISEWVCIFGGLAILGVKEIPGDFFTAIMSKFAPGGQK